MDSVIVLAKTTTLFLLIAVGWLSRRRGYLSAEATSILGRFVVDFSLPALILVQLIATVDRHTLRQDWASLVLAVLVLGLALGLGVALSPALAPRKSRSTCAFLIGIPNWIYLPLPIAQELFGGDGVRAVLLCNIVFQLLLWSVGLAVLRGRLDRGALRRALLNPGLAAALIGIGLAILAPELRTYQALSLSAAPSAGPIAVKVVLDSAALLGQLTIPLSLLLIGAQLGGMARPKIRDIRLLSSLVAARLLLGPLVTVLAFQGLGALGWAVPEVPRKVALLISAMPVAVTCGIITERYGGDADLSAGAIFTSTLLCLLTVPLWMLGFAAWPG